MKHGAAKVMCSCTHEFQDKEHGKGVRVACATTKEPSPSTIEVRCTVCGKAHTVSKEKVR